MTRGSVTKKFKVGKAEIFKDGGEEDGCKNKGSVMSADSLNAAQPAVKGACLSASATRCEERSKSYVEGGRRLAASATLEAALVIPLFIYAVCAVMYLLQLVGIQVHIQEALYNEVRTMAKYGYAMDCIGNEVSSVEKYQGVLDSDGAQLLSKGSGIGCAYALFINRVGSDYAWDNHIAAGSAGFNMAASNIGEEEMEIVVSYYIENPFDIFGIGKKRYTQKAYAKTWTGDDSDNASKTGDNNSASVDELGGKYVYVAADSEVYHTTSACTYLKPSVSTVSASQVGAAKNSYGNRYSPCDYCIGKKSDNVSGKCYVTSYGERYHSTGDCSRLKRSYSIVAADAKGDLRLCSKCGKNSE